MPKVLYGSKAIEYTVHIKDGLKAHYISVERENGVVLKGKEISFENANKLILKKAKWIINKQELVKSVKEDDIVTGSRIPYLGRNYYVQLFLDKVQAEAKIEFNHSQFKITVNPKEDTQKSIQKALDKFYKEKAIEKIIPRAEEWSMKTGLRYNKLKFLKMSKRWGSCSPSNTIVVNTEVIKLPYSLIDYIIVHELCHVKVKDHSKRFYGELEKYMVKWKFFEEKLLSVNQI